MSPVILFPCDELRPARVDAGFDAESEAAVLAGFSVALIDHSAAQAGDTRRALRHTKLEGHGGAMYRGCMLHADCYAELFSALAAPGWRLVNDPAHYRQAHWLPQSSELLRELTPETVYLSGPPPYDDERLRALAARLGSGPALVKDFVKSEKHLWDEACLIPDVQDVPRALRVIRRFLELRPEPEGGIVLRRFEPFVVVGESAGRPVAAEWRSWWVDGELLVWTTNHDVPETPDQCPPDTFLRAAAARLSSRFFSLDVAQRTDGQWRVVEAGDGQVSGLPPSLPASDFYAKLARHFEGRPNL